MPTTKDSPLPVNTARCPLCDAPLDPADLSSCPKCDWVAPRADEPTGGTRDKIAVCLSVVPGLGHIYKGHRTTGILYMIGSVFAFAFCFLAGAASAGWGLLLMPLYWIGVMLQVYFLEDLAVGQKKS